ncbi:MAG: hypothetical protein WBB82_06505 [Limnothrix sp.]
MKLQTSFGKVFLLMLALTGADLSSRAIADEVFINEPLPSNTSNAVVLPEKITNEPIFFRFNNNIYGDVEAYSLAESVKENLEPMRVNVDAAADTPQSEGKDSPLGMIKFPFNNGPARDTEAEVEVELDEADSRVTPGGMY